VDLDKKNQKKKIKKSTGRWNRPSTERPDIGNGNGHDGKRKHVTSTGEANNLARLGERVKTTRKKNYRNGLEENKLV
jgi:hypothetical protein